MVIFIPQMRYKKGWHIIKTKKAGFSRTPPSLFPFLSFGAQKRFNQKKHTFKLYEKNFSFLFDTNITHYVCKWFHF